MATNVPSKVDPCSDRRDIECKTHRDIEQYMAERVKFKIDVYYCKARRFRFKHYLFSVVIAISAALVPVLIGLDSKITFIDLTVVASFVSLLVSVGVACQEIFRFREQWRNYDLIDANLRNEEMLFSMSAGRYQKIVDDDSKRKLFVERIEQLIQNERTETINMRTSAVTVSESKQVIEGIINDYLKGKEITFKGG